MDGEQAYLLSRVAFAGRLSDGRIVVANGADLEIRYFGPDGRHIATVGGPGEGPGEFVAFAEVYLDAGDTVWVRDARSPRITVVSPLPLAVRDYPVASLDRGTSLRFEGPLGSNRVATTTRVNPIIPADLDAEARYLRDSVTVSILTLETLVMMPIATVPAAERFIPSADSPETRVIQGPGGRSFQMRLPVSIPFGHDAHHGVLGRSIVFGTTESPELRVMDDTGRLTRILRLEREPVPLSSELRQRDLDWTLENARADGRPDPAAEVSEYRAGLDMVPEGHVVPYFEDLLTDAAGRIWVRDYRFRWEAEGPQVWNVFEADGRPAARIEMPSGLRVMHLGPEYVTGVIRDELDVEYVVVHRIEAGP